MATVCKRVRPGAQGRLRTTWVVWYADPAGKRRNKTFPTETEALSWRDRHCLPSISDAALHIPEARGSVVSPGVLRALTEALAERSEARGEGESKTEVLRALARIERALSLQNARLAQATRIEHGDRILRRLTELERLVRGGDLHVPPRQSRRRPLGAS
jgi:hypothetical protein